MERVKKEEIKEDFKEITTFIRGQNWKPWIKQLIAIFSTLGAAFGTIWLAIVSSNNISLTKELSDRSWRPEVFMEFPPEGYRIDSLTEEYSPTIHKRHYIKGPVYRISNVIWTNSGGSPALNVRTMTQTSVPSDTFPGVDTLTILESSSSLTIRPNQIIKQTWDFKSYFPLKVNDTTCVHLGVWYQDRKGGNYLEETVFYILGEPKTGTEIVWKKMYDFDWATKKWK